MLNPGNIDPVEAMHQRQAAEEARKRHDREQAALNRANKLKLLSDAEQRLAGIDSPIVSEFVVSNSWWTKEQVSDRRDHKAFEENLQSDPDQQLLATLAPGFLSNRYKHTVAVRHEREKARYYGSWLLLSSTSTEISRGGGWYNSRSGLIKLRESHAGYASVSMGGCDPRNSGNIRIHSNVLDRDPIHRRRGLDIRNVPWKSKPLELFESLEEAVDRGYQDYSVEDLTKLVAQALGFVATGQPPKTTVVAMPPYEY